MLSGQQSFIEISMYKNPQTLLSYRTFQNRITSIYRFIFNPWHALCHAIQKGIEWKKELSFTGLGRIT